LRSRRHVICKLVRKPRRRTRKNSGLTRYDMARRERSLEVASSSWKRTSWQCWGRGGRGEGLVSQWFLIEAPLKGDDQKFAASSHALADYNWTPSTSFKMAPSTLQLRPNSTAPGTILSSFPLLHVGWAIFHKNTPQLNPLSIDVAVPPEIDSTP